MNAKCEDLGCRLLTRIYDLADAGFRRDVGADGKLQRVKRYNNSNFLITSQLPQASAVRLEPMVNSQRAVLHSLYLRSMQLMQGSAARLRAKVNIFPSAGFCSAAYHLLASTLSCGWLPSVRSSICTSTKCACRSSFIGLESWDLLPKFVVLSGLSVSHSFGLCVSVVSVELERLFGDYNESNYSCMDGCTISQSSGQSANTEWKEIRNLWS